MSNPKPININGYDTYFMESQDDIGQFLLIAIPPSANNDMSDICGTFVDSKFIRQISYCETTDARFIKAYF